MRRRKTIKYMVTYSTHGKVPIKPIKAPPLRSLIIARLNQSTTAIG